MKKIICDKIIRVIKNKEKLEEVLNVKISNKGNEVIVDGTGENEYYAEKVIDALNLGFPYSEAISIKSEDKAFEIISIKDYAKKNLEKVRGRLIGKSGKVLKSISELTGCALELKENKIGIIGESEDIERTIQAIVSIISGVKHSSVYHALEKSHPEPIYDYGLKNEKEIVTMEEFNKRLGMKDKIQQKNEFHKDQDYFEDDED